LKTKAIPIKLDDETRWIIKAIAAIEGVTIGDLLKKWASEHSIGAAALFERNVGKLKPGYEKAVPPPYEKRKKDVKKVKALKTNKASIEKREK
jgi:hypothetical protein